MMGGHRMMAAESAQRTSIMSPSPDPSPAKKRKAPPAAAGDLPTPPSTQATMSTRTTRKRAKMTAAQVATPAATQEEARENGAEHDGEDNTNNNNTEAPAQAQNEASAAPAAEADARPGPSAPATRTRRRGADALGSLADLALQSAKPGAHRHPIRDKEWYDRNGAANEAGNGHEGMDVSEGVTVEALQVAAQSLQADDGAPGLDHEMDDVEGVIDDDEEYDDEEEEEEEEEDDDEEEEYNEGDEADAEGGARKTKSTNRPRARAAPKDKGEKADKDGKDKPKKTPKPKKEPRVKRAKPLAAPRNRWGREQKDVDADLRLLLDTPEKAQAYLASKWIDAKELHRLEELRLITYKRGKWTEGERLALREHITLFQRGNNLSDEALLEIILSKGRFDKRSAYPHFWAELAEKVPGRPVKYVVTAVQRMYDPRARKGAWTQEEDSKLLTAYAENPNKWTTIADIVGRTVHDCRDRWKCELRDKDKRKKGPWTEEETIRLREAVIKANTDAGLEPLSSDTPWDAVVKLMDETRSRTQCRKKWQDTMGYGQRTETARKRGSKLDSRVLLSRLRELGIKHEADVEYARVTLPEWGLTPAQVRRKWNHLKSLIANRENLSFSELLTQIELNLKPEDWRKRKRGQSGGMDEGQVNNGDLNGVVQGVIQDVAPGGIDEHLRSGIEAGVYAQANNGIDGGVDDRGAATELPAGVETLQPGIDDGIDPNLENAEAIDPTLEHAEAAIDPNLENAVSNVDAVVDPNLEAAVDGTEAVIDPNLSNLPHFENGIPEDVILNAARAVEEAAAVINASGAV